MVCVCLHFFMMGHDISTVCPDSPNTDTEHLLDFQVTLSFIYAFIKWLVARLIIPLAMKADAQQNLLPVSTYISYCVGVIKKQSIDMGNTLGVMNSYVFMQKAMCSE